MQLLFLDLETTGLDPHSCSILEVAACVVQGHALCTNRTQTWPEFSSVIFASGQALAKMSTFVRDMHANSGLLEACQHPDLSFLSEVEAALVRHVQAFTSNADKEPLYLAGSSIHFDRAFIKVHMPQLESLLHYRMLDVSSFRLMVEFIGLPVFEPEGEKRHRALSDMRGSIEIFKHYKAIFHAGLEPRIVETIQPVSHFGTSAEI